MHGDACGAGTGLVRRPAWRADYRWGDLAGLDETVADAALTVKILRHATATYTFNYSVAVDDRLLQAGTIVIDVRHWSAVRIYEDEDDFVNYCIDETRTIHKISGRLYCVEPPFSTYRSSVQPQR